MSNINQLSGTVLVVDDTPGNLRVLVDSLSARGLDVLVATDGKSAVERAVYGQPDLILLDVIMPGIDGFETCRIFKETPETSAIPVIFMTALSDTSQKVKAFEVGAVDYVTKPFEEEELIARVDTHLTIRSLQADLERRNHQLEELNQLKNEFLGMAAHDIRNPLTAILAGAEILELTAGSAAAEKVIQTSHQIQIAGNRIQTLLTNLLDVNAIDSGKRNIEIEPIELRAVLEQVTANHEPSARSKNIEIIRDQTTDGESIMADVCAAGQVLDNLVSNAIKYSPPEQRVWISTERRGDIITITIRDEGPGLSQEDQKKMFGKFARLTPRPTAGETSTGLGLWIVKELVQSMNGSIRCESTLGEGATFTVEFRCAEVPAVAAG
jgi:two-component system sensor histidine kinase/response regulator